jgi:hypothetical protein
MEHKNSDQNIIKSTLNNSSYQVRDSSGMVSPHIFSPLDTGYPKSKDMNAPTAAASYGRSAGCYSSSLNYGPGHGAWPTMTKATHSPTASFTHSDSEGTHQHQPGLIHLKAVEPSKASPSKQGLPMEPCTKNSGGT